MIVLLSLKHEPHTVWDFRSRCVSTGMLSAARMALTMCVESPLSRIGLVTLPPAFMMAGWGEAKSQVSGVCWVRVSVDQVQ